MSQSFSLEEAEELLRSPHWTIPFYPICNEAGLGVSEWADCWVEGDPLELWLTASQIEGVLDPLDEGAWVVEKRIYWLRLLWMVEGAPPSSLPALSHLSPCAQLYLEEVIFRGAPLSQQAIDRLGERFPSSFRARLRQHLRALSLWRGLAKRIPLLASFSETKLPFLPFSASLPEGSCPSPEGVLLPEPLSFSSPLSPSLLLFRNLAHLYHVAQFPSWHPLLLSLPLLLLDRPPSLQLALQGERATALPEDSPLHVMGSSWQLPQPFEKAFCAFAHGWNKCPGQVDPVIERELTLRSREWSWQMRGRRLGVPHGLRWRMVCRGRDWQEQEKGAGATFPEWHKALSLSSKQPCKERVIHSPIRIAHLASGLVDGGHAPTRLLLTLLAGANPAQFRPYLFLSELHRLRPADYPQDGLASLPSAERGKESLRQLEEAGVAIWIEEEGGTLSGSARRLVEALEEAEIDLLICHGGDSINLEVASASSIPFTVYFDHSEPLPLPLFHLVISSDEEEAKKPLYAQRDIPIFSLPFVVDVEAGWRGSPPLREEEGLPKEGTLLTTLSFHLDSRLSPEMCQAILYILQEAEEAFYLPIGPISSEKERELMDFFAQGGVADRVRFLGRTSRAPHLLRAMDLYLNEFPFGGCLSVLDALAASLPVMTMYQEEGPPQGRYGAYFYGRERAIMSGRWQDYAEQALLLMRNPHLYADWAQAARDAYLARGKAKEYVRRFEEILLNYLEGRGAPNRESASPQLHL